MAAATRAVDYDTVIIGAGMSGLACGSRLFQRAHYKHKGRLLVLEARDRIGGRIGSVKVNGSRLDTGANWIHGVGTTEKRNPLMDILPHKKYRELGGRVAFRHPGSEREKAVIASEQDLPEDSEWVRIEAEPSTQKHDTPLHKASGDLVIPGEIAGTLTGSLWGLIASLHELAEMTPAAEAKRTTMLEAITRSRALQDTFDSIPEEYHRTVSGTPQFIENMEAAPLAAQSAEHPQGQAGMSLLEFALDDFEGDQVFLPDGYTAVVDEVAKELMSAGVIQTGKEVRQIRWNTDPVEIETASGTYTANRVVCSLPLGVLQHHQSQVRTAKPLFSPSLASEKREAIENLGFGTLDKIFLVYSTPWWNEEPYLSILQKGIATPPSNSDSDPDDGTQAPNTALDSFSGFTPELPGLAIHRNGTTTQDLSSLSLINLHALTGYPVLSCFISCANAARVEQMPDEQAGGMLHRALTSWLGREPPRPEAVHVTRWAQDEYSRGSYSHMITGLSEVGHRLEFQRPVVGGKGAAVLRFAGEHTSRNHFATVHGALLSGWREADAILEKLDAR
ncbi:hypothetical protein LTR91_018835 [Friedmanniomyces endolithicus]|uniref:Amine oxidase domain-containing protein n=1 Tax=Friedmanniomyces endolithicus TaxID=329885 RepID=A0AAN6K2K7_9PEZI|nr:hypothetical protein LTR35_006856 [Friedmanniomyces endolithicus]KAK0296022.1 hypothetical protein LTS00_005307 [Friedmanniomyces endolithicus]KAK0316796.1 hypothetical protein LTR01_000547 [Friedmanniomyces endolithicus]KAK0328005.1 hypothetical protein LTR82_001524 [Friedmanniomyces endolithicus]KAK0834973.1 hypothetical protein LTR73_001265 [Friedmanniomyces endolithicus]